MKKWNIAGFIIFLVVAGFTGWSFAEGNSGMNFMPLFLFAFAGVVLLGLDRWAGDSKYGVFPITLLWAAYWGLVAFGLISVAGFYGFVFGFGHGDSEKRWTVEWLMYGYVGTTILFTILALANITKIFAALFSLLKLKAH